MYIFIKEVDTTNGDLYHGGTMSYTTFGTWGRGNEGDKILKCYTFDLFAIRINTVIPCVFFHFCLKLRIIPYLCEIDIRTLPSFGPHKND